MQKTFTASVKVGQSNPFYVALSILLNNFAEALPKSFGKYALIPNEQEDILPQVIGIDGALWLSKREPTITLLYLRDDFLAKMAVRRKQNLNVMKRELDECIQQAIKLLEGEFEFGIYRLVELQQYQRHSMVAMISPKGETKEKLRAFFKHLRDFDTQLGDIAAARPLHVTFFTANQEGIDFHNQQVLKQYQIREI